MLSLWENSRMRVWKVEGRVANFRVGAHEPEGINYSFYSAFRPRAKQRGTMFGCPGLGEYHRTFHGAVRYDTLTLVTHEGKQLLLKDVIAIKKFQPFIYTGNRCALYLLSGKDSNESTMIFALETGNNQVDDLAGIGSMGEILMSSVRRQIKIIAIPAAFSIGLFCAMILPTVASILGGIVYLGFGIICAFMTPFIFIGVTVLKKNLQFYPSNAVLQKILQQEGFTQYGKWGVAS
ncbi:MAG: hypothetical protein PVH01_14910 [Desulfobacterales bacterium]|jgi:hypothetical protein